MKDAEIGFLPARTHKHTQHFMFFASVAASTARGVTDRMNWHKLGRLAPGRCCGVQVLPAMFHFNQ